MTYFKSTLSVVSCFHTAIDLEQAGKNKEAYKKYAEGLSAIGTSLQIDAHLLHQPQVVNLHKHMLEFARKSTDRLLTLLETIGDEDLNSSFDLDSVSNNNNNNNNNSLSTYRKLSETLPEIITETPLMPVSIPDEIPGVYSPLSFIEEDNKRMIRMYENRVESLINPAAKANLHLELERRLAENNALARKRYEDWEKRRKILASECRQMAEEKFYIQEKIKCGTVNDSDFTKQNLYAVCLQFHKEHTWAQEYSCKLLENITYQNNVKKILNFFLQNGSYPLACVLRQVQQKTTNKLSKLNMSQITYDENEKNILKEHFKNIVQDTKEDLFMLMTVMQALWEPLNTDANQLVLIDVLHHLYFPTVKPYFIQLLRIILHREEEEMIKCMQHSSEQMISFPSTLNSVIVKLHQLTLTHSPSVMMVLLVEILRSLIHVHSCEILNDEMPSLSLGIDNIMPKLIQLILLSNMSTLPAEISFAENFMPARKALAEEGYTVTLFQNVLSYIYLNSNSLSNQ